MTSQPVHGSGNPAAPSCAVEQSQIGAVSVVTVSGTVDMLTAPQLESALSTVAIGAAQAVVVDLSAVDFLASAGMGALVAAHAELAPAVRLVIVADGPTTSRPLKLVGIADLIELFATRDEALAAVTA
ncbi:STAS domain-containing protein [Mycolicibacterium aubagnense]|uniref:Anti-sigma factor antagonist n=1 Tax=Mycolicibacterium aubagnense TaxID=319707 RepID=A0ABN5YQE4_9MYCO|nr:STAS domain-containing protein [Mycolicibacterium aubagnense]TLH57791.1 anti-anti-sigma factor [Mycolicibacterium aubagnense]WGI34162.1 STAS domain-containing protein [Mycolicibacterium aubagnense]BBX84027.1 anti-sigma factor antagonist [Mycolicibacterium aubagnense]